MPTVMVLLRRMSQCFGFKMCADISDGNVLSCERAYVKYINKKKKGLKESDRFVFLDFFSINYISFSDLQLVDLSLLRS